MGSVSSSPVNAIQVSNYLLSLLLPSLTTQKRPSSFKLPAEIRNLIYRELFVAEGSLIKVDLKLYWLVPYGNGSCKLSSQFLRVCRQVYQEGRAVLWGCNTWEIRVNYPYTGHDFDLPTIDIKARRFESFTCRKLMRNVHIVLLTEGWNWACDVREPLQTLSTFFRSLDKIHELHLELVASYDAADGIPSGAVAVEGYGGRGPLDITRHIKSITTWIGDVRKVTHARVTGLPPQVTEFLTTKWKSSDPVNPLPKMLIILEKYTFPLYAFRDVAHIMRDAIKATEDDDLDTFKSCRKRVMRRTVAYFQEMKVAIYREDIAVTAADGKAEKSTTDGTSTRDSMTTDEEALAVTTDDFDAWSPGIWFPDSMSESSESGDGAIASDDEGNLADDEVTNSDDEIVTIGDEYVVTEDEGTDAGDEIITIDDEGSAIEDEDTESEDEDMADQDTAAADEVAATDDEDTPEGAGMDSATIELSIFPDLD